MSDLKIYDVAESIINYCNSNDIDISNLKLQKLLYFYQRNNYIRTGELAFSDEFQAYKYGPVHEGVWKKYRNKDLMNRKGAKINSNFEDELIEKNLLTYLNASVWGLVNESHKSGVWKKYQSVYKGIMSNQELMEEWNEEV